MRLSDREDDPTGRRALRAARREAHLSFACGFGLALVVAAGVLAALWVY